MYFPQFNIGIECDEPHHISRQENDLLRTEDIIEELGKYNEQRITVYDKSIIDINNSIDKIVELIKISKQEQIKNGIFKKMGNFKPTRIFCR